MEEFIFIKVIECLYVIIIHVIIFIIIYYLKINSYKKLHME